MSQDQVSKLLFWVVPVLYCVAYAPFGIDDFDTGFVLGLSWQLLEGGSLYSDIYYIRPPLTPFLNTITLYSAGDLAVFVSRCIFFVMMALSSVLTFKVLQKLQGKSMNREAYLFALLAFVFSVNTFPAMPWHTVDGIFFSVLGIYSATCLHSRFNLLFSAFFLFCALLSKQSFYLVPLSVVFYFLLVGAPRKSAVLLVWLLAQAAIYVWCLQSFGDLDRYLELTTGQTSIFSLIEAGILSYAKDAEYLAYVLLPPALIAFGWSKWRPESVTWVIYVYGLIIWIATFSIKKYVSTESYVGVVKHFPDVLFIATSLLVVFKTSLKPIRYHVLLFNFISWSSSISWGAPSTALFQAPYFWLMYFLVAGKDVFAWVKLVTLTLSLTAFFIGNQIPYNLERPIYRENMTWHLGDIFPRLRFIYSDQQTFEKLKDLKALTNRHPDVFTVLPAGTLTHYVTNTKNPVGVDWAMDAEVNGLSDEAMSRLEANDVTVFVSKSGFNAVEKYGSSLTARVKEEWTLVQSTRYYDVYKR